VLILGELRYRPLTREEASLFFRLLVRRYERASLIVGHRTIHFLSTFVPQRAQKRQLKRV
jgi:DNA replication protein DnaC